MPDGTAPAEEGRGGAEAPRAAPASSPGSSGPEEHGYRGEATVGDEGAAAGPEAYTDPFGRPEPGGPGGDEDAAARRARGELGTDGEGR